MGCGCYVGNAIPLIGTEIYHRAKDDLRFGEEELEEVIHYLSLPRKIHCLTSPYWKAKEIFKICKQEQKKNFRAIHGSYGLGGIVRKFIKHPIRSFRKSLRVI